MGSNVLMTDAELDPQGLRNLLINDAHHVERLDNTDCERRSWYYQVVLSMLTCLELDEQEARHHYQEILRHRADMSEKMHRNVGFRVACLDYFTNITSRLANPKVVEVVFYEQLLEQSKLDPKTGCYNLPFFHDLCKTELQKAERHQHPVAVLMLDLDNFKSLNDRLGHLAGDEILQYSVHEIEQRLRQEDLLARYGGDEFVCLLPHTDHTGVEGVIERMQDLFQHFHSSELPDGLPMKLSFSGGAAVYPWDGRSVDELLAVADRRLYQAKHAGKDCIHLSDKLLTQSE